MKTLLLPTLGLSKTIISRIPAVCRRSFVQTKCVSGNLQTTESNEVISVLDEPAELSVQSEEDVERKRNKSRLYPQHLNKLRGRLPYSEPKADFHNTLQYKRRMFGRYGSQSNIDPGTLWPTKGEIEDILEYERVAYPNGFQETVQILTMRKYEERQEIDERQRRIAENLKKLENWKKEITERTAKKQAEAAAAKAKKDALIEEVRRHFGYNVDPRDDRFKEMLIQKERDQKKKLKAERAKAKQEKLLASMLKSDS